VQRVPDGIVAQAGPDAVHLSTPAELRGENLTTVAEFTVGEGASERFALSWFPSYERPARTEDTQSALTRTEAWWRDWSERCSYQGDYRNEVMTSLIVLKGLTDQVTGAVVAAPTTSLPEDLGGERNWDYRYTWLRDSVLTLNALLAGGYTDEARAFIESVFRATAGHPEQAQIMYGIAGERRLDEYELDWLPGYEGSKPVRVGNAAAGQFQLDVYGEVVGVGWAEAAATGQFPPRRWRQLRKLLDYLETVWREPDDGMWEARGPRRHYTQSKLMAWVAFDRAISLGEQFGLEGPLERWKQIRTELHDEILDKAYDPQRKTFTQSYGSKALDAGALMVGLVGLLPPTDDRFTGTIDAVRTELGHDGFSRATRPTRPTTACRAARPSSSPARSGSSTRSRPTAVRTRRGSCSSGCSRCATTSACTQRSTTSPASGRSATSRRPSPTWPSSTPRGSSAAIGRGRDRRHPLRRRPAAMGEPALGAHAAGLRGARVPAPTPLCTGAELGHRWRGGWLGEGLAR
jgi:hypothetical protein